MACRPLTLLPFAGKLESKGESCKKAQNRQAETKALKGF